MHNEQAVRIGLVGCVKTKLDHAAVARDLYVSALFRGRRAYVETSCDRWFILSSLYGLVDSDEVIETYEQSLKGVTTAARRQWAKEVLRSLDEQLGDMSHIIFEVHAGDDYTGYGLAQGLLERDARLEWPVRGLTMGEQLAFYSNRTASPDTAPGPFESGVPPVTVAPRPDYRRDNDVAEQAGGRPADEDRMVASALDALAFPPRLVRLCDWPGEPEGLEQPGLYVLHVDEEGARQLSEGLGYELAAGRLYLGHTGATSAGRVSSSGTLLGRIGGNHLRGTIQGSTLRLSLAAILRHQLDLQKVGDDKLSRESEQRLSEWMRQRLAVAVFAIADQARVRWIATQAICALDPPLNLAKARPDPLRHRLKALRKELADAPSIWDSVGPLNVVKIPVPSPRTAWNMDIVKFALTYNGYERHGDQEQVSAISENVRQLWLGGRLSEADLPSLRCTLFFLQRGFHWTDDPPDADFLAALLSAIRDKSGGWLQGPGDEWP